MKQDLRNETRPASAAPATGAKNSILSFEKFSAAVAKVTGSSAAFAIAMGVVLIWAVCGPLFQYSNGWQLVINTGTTIITFLMVFIIQQAQNKDTLALQLKLNELIAATKGASNKVLNIEDLTEEELKMLKHFYSRLNEKSAREKDPGAHHSLDDEVQERMEQQIDADMKNKNNGA